MRSYRAFVYSRIISIKNDNKENNLLAYPNPAMQNVNAQIKLDISQTVWYKLLKFQ